jgi:hypothetical protein
VIVKGNLVSSNKGHDFGRIYLVVDLQGDFAWCVDGKYRMLENPKKKRIKHLDNLFVNTKNLLKKLDDKTLYDYEIATFIKKESNVHKD